MYRITFPLVWIFFGSCFDVPGVGVFSRMKSAGFVSGLGGASFRLFQFSTAAPVIFNFFDSDPTIFSIFNPPVSIRLSAFTVGPSYFFIFGKFII